MSNSVFNNKEFEIYGIVIPEFTLKKGNLIRMYIPNFDHNKNLPLGFDLAVELIQRFQDQKSNFPWAKNYQQSWFLKILNPLTVGTYLLHKMGIDQENANRITSEIGINLADKFELLSFSNRKALIIKALFHSHESILLDYYGVSAMGIDFLEAIVNSEIKKGKSAIAFDRLEFKLKKEPFNTITPIDITTGPISNSNNRKQLKF